MIKPAKRYSTKNQQHAALRWIVWILLISTIFVLAGCQESSRQEITPPRPSAQPTAATALTSTPWTPSPKAPTPTPLPTVTATLIDDRYFRDMPLSQTGYLLPLTIRHVNENSAVLFFELEQPVEGDLFVRQLTGLEKHSQTIPLSAENARHQIVVENLVPGMEYEAIVGLSNAQGVYEQPDFLDEAWGSVHFRTQSNAEPLRVGVIGDSGFGEPVTAKLVDQMAKTDLDFVIHTGDIIYHGGDNANPAEAFAVKFYKPFSPILHEMPVYTVPGNHEYESAVRWQDVPFYYYALPPYPDPVYNEELRSDQGQYYAAAYQGVQFLMLDSQVFWGGPSREEQDAWLLERLKDNRFSYSIAVFHIPPFTSSAVHPEHSSPLRTFWHPLFASARVPVVLSGHNHHYERLFAGEITYIVSGGGSGVLYGAGVAAPESQFFAASTHFVLMEIYRDRIEISAIDQDGAVFDQAAIAVEVFHGPPGD